jgi:hypothetical protein
MEALASTTGQHIRITNPWHAVEVRSGLMACPACRELAGKRFLSSEAPALPIAGCLHPVKCRAVYQKHDDRRAGPRREAEQGMAGRSPPRDAANEQRIGRGRRSSDASR